MPMSPVEALKKHPKKAGLGTIAIALLAIYVNEGGFVDDPHDRGGATNFGVTEKVARKWGYTGRMQDFPKHCDEGQPVCADLIYTTDYIDRPGYRPLASIEPAVLYELTDSAVLHGPGRASKWFQLALNANCGAGLDVDGRIGQKTIAAYQACQAKLGAETACLRVLDSMDGRQRVFFNTLASRDLTQRRFLKGWISRRVGNVDRALCKREAA